MSLSLYSRTPWLLGLAASLAGCASTPLLAPAGLPPEAQLDDGIDYYSAAVNDEKAFESEQDQWTTDEEGNRVYLINQVRQGAAAAYYVGDIRYAFVNDNSDGSRSSLGVPGQPGFGSNSFFPRDNRPLRNTTNNMLYQPRRGRITYLPSRTQPQSQNNNTGSGTSTTGSTSQPPRPTASPPRTTRRTAVPPSTRSQRRSQPGNTTRQADR